MSAVKTQSPESSGHGTAYAFIRPMPTQRPDTGAPAGEPRSPYEAVVARLFPPHSPGDRDSLVARNAAGVTLGYFQIEERIGQGGMGAVFRAIDQRLDRVVALKVLAPDQSRDALSVQRFQNEARAAARLDHENIAAVHYIGEDQGLHFIAFEFVRGGNVRDIIVEKGVLHPGEALNYTLQIAQALRHTEAAGVVHRDIKPSNIIVTPSGRAKLVDLGLARQVHGEAGGAELTVAGTTLGTFDYIAPEQARDPRDVDVRSDIYALGCTLYHMLTGSPPYPRGTFIQKVVDHHSDEPPDPARINRHVPVQLSRIVQKMMASRPDDRYGSPEELIQTLIPIAQAYGLRGSPSDALLWSPSPRPAGNLFWERNRGWIVTTMVLITIVAVINRLPIDSAPTGGESSGGGLVAQTSRPTGQGAAAPSTDPDQPPLPPRIPESPRVVSAAAASSGASRADVGTSEPPPGPTPETGNPPPANGTAMAAPGAANDRTPEASAVVSPMVVASTADTPPPPASSALPIRTSTTPPPSSPPTAPSPIPEPRIDPFHVLGLDKSYASLEAACADAPDKSVIELAFDGLWPDRQGPVRIQNKSLVIRPAEGRRPAIIFEVPPTVDSQHATRMFAVENGAIELYDVDFIVPVERGFITDRWSLISLDQAVKVKMRGVSVSMFNPLHLPAAILESVEPKRAEMKEMMIDRPSRATVAIDLEACIFRGDADLFVGASVTPVDLQMRQVAMALHGSVANLPGADTSMPSGSASSQQVALRLDHVTAVLDRPFLNVDAGSSRVHLPVQVDVRDSVLAIMGSARPLISLSGPEDVDAQMEAFVWRSDRQRSNLVSLPAAAVFWEIRSPESLDPAPRTLGPAEWSEYWYVNGDRLTTSEIFTDAATFRDARFVEAQPVDFLLEETDPESGSPLKASDGASPGVDWNSSYLPSSLPALGPDPERGL